MQSNTNSDGEPHGVAMEDDEMTSSEMITDGGDGGAEVVRLDPQMSDILEEAIEGEMSDEESDFIDDSIDCLEAHSSDAFCVDCTANWVVTGGEDDSAAIFRIDSEGRTLAYRLTKHSDSVTCAKFNAAGTLLATGDMSGKILITDLSNLSERCEMDDCTDLEWIEWHFATDVLFAGGGDGVIWMYLIGLHGVAQTKTFAGSVGSGCTVGKLLRDGKRLLAGYANGAVMVWSLKDGISTVIAGASGSSCTTADEHAEYNWAVVGTDSGRCLMINTKTIALMPDSSLQVEDIKEEEDDTVNIPEVKSTCVECVRFCKSKDPWLAVASNYGTLSIYEVGGSISPRHKFLHDGQVVVKCLWHDGGNFLISACLDGTLRIWDARNGKLVKCLSGGGEEVYDFVLQSNLVYTVSANGHLRVFEI